MQHSLLERERAVVRKAKRLPHAAARDGRCAHRGLTVPTGAAASSTRSPPRCGWLPDMDTDVTMEARLRVALVCAPEVLRLGMERMLAQDATLKVVARRRLDAVRGPADVAVLAERRLGDAAAACDAAASQLDAGVVVVVARPDPHVVLDCLAVGATGFVAEGDGPGHLRTAIVAAATGEYHVGPQVLTSMLDWQRSERRRPHSSQ